MGWMPRAWFDYISIYSYKKYIKWPCRLSIILECPAEHELLTDLLNCFDWCLSDSFSFWCMSYDFFNRFRSWWHWLIKTYNRFWSIFWLSNLDHWMRRIHLGFTFFTKIVIWSDWAFIPDTNNRFSSAPITIVTMMYSLWYLLYLTLALVHTHTKHAFGHFTLNMCFYFLGDHSLNLLKEFHIYFTLAHTFSTGFSLLVNFFTITFKAYRQIFGIKRCFWW